MQKWLKIVQELKKHEEIDNVSDILRAAGFKSAVSNIIYTAIRHGIVSKYDGDTIYWSDGTKTKLLRNNKRRKNRMIRLCMTCGEPFLSAHKFNRICAECKKTRVREAEWAII